MPSTSDEVQRQRDYYQRTAAEYEHLHVSDEDQHSLALAFMSGAINWLGIRSVLDIGSGTGRAIHFLKRHCPGVRVVGVEPVAALREIGHAQGLSAEELRDGDVSKLSDDDGAFDLVCEFAVLHHVKRPDEAVGEMLRVARRAVFISDSNNFGQGSPTGRFVKQTLRTTGLWPLANWIKTRGRGYYESEEDGLAYPYSVFDNYAQIAGHCRRVHVLNTDGDGRRSSRAAGHAAILGIK